MEPRIVERGDVILAGMVFYGDPFRGAESWSQENEIGRLWKRFNALWDAKRDLIRSVSVSDAGYEVHIEPEEYDETKNFYVMMGVQVDRVEPPPLELSFKVLPATTYVVFTLRGSEIRSNWPSRIYKEWLPDSSYEEAHKFTVEYYAPNFSGMDDPESELEVHVPVRPRAA
jgi:AraC family transcriptional regulator